MKKMLLALLVVFAMGTIVNAQDSTMQKKQQFQWNKKTMDEIGISPDVQVKINDIKKANDEEIKKVKDDAALNEEQKKDKLKELRKKRMADIEALLTPEQKAKADAMRKEMKKNE
jgi:periplasmic protein CpxP/Spy